MATKKKVTKKKTATKKRTSKKASNGVVKTKATRMSEANEEPVVDEDGNRYLSRLDLARYDLAEHKWTAMLQARKLKEREKQDAVTIYDRDIAVLRAQEKQKLGALMQLRAELHAKYGVNFNDQNVSFDDETGRIIVFDAPRASVEAEAS